jgi:hypothetical protein
VTSTSARAEQVAASYARHADRLRRIVAANAHAPEQTIEDACQHSWAILLRRDDIALDHRGFACLATIAIRGAWRLGSRPPRARRRGSSGRSRVRHLSRAAGRDHRPGRTRDRARATHPSA